MMFIYLEHIHHLFIMVTPIIEKYNIFAITEQRIESQMENLICKHQMCLCIYFTYNVLYIYIELLILKAKLMISFYALMVHF